MTIRPASDPVLRRRRIAGVVALVGGAAVIAGSYGDWVRADVLGVGLVNGSGWENVRGHLADGPVFAALGLVLVLVGATMMFGFASRVGKALGALSALGAVGGTIYEIVDITSAGRAELLAGPWIMLTGAVVGLLGVLAAPAGRPESTSQRTLPQGPLPPRAVVPPSGPPLLQ